MPYKNFRTLNELKIKNKKILLRIDLNSEIINKKPVLSGRIKEHAKTILELKRKKAKVIILAHQSRPGRLDFISLKHHAKLLNKYVKIKFISDVLGKKSETAIKNLKSGDAILLDNIRSVEDEFNPSKNNKIINFFKDKVDIYINDAFSICHRNETSITMFPKILPSAIGRVLKSELKNIDKIKSNVKEALFVLGGNKIKDISLLFQKRKILPTGVLALLVLKAKGYKIKNNHKDLNLIKKNLKHFVIPEDLAFKINGKRKNISKEKFPSNALALDIGKDTIKLYEREILKAKNILWKGTAGDCSKKGFCLGTKSLLKTIEKSKAFCIVSGGHSETAVERFKINKNRLGYVSLSGGALIYYILGKKLPGLDALRK